MGFHPHPASLIRGEGKEEEMYIWIVLVTFIVALTGFNLAFRADIAEVTTEPMAEAVIFKIWSQQTAASRFIFDHTPPTNGLTEIAYVEGVLDFDDLEQYLPYGYTETAANEYTSYIYCMDKESADLSVGVPCNDPQAVRYLATYGCVPLKWRNFNTGRPKAALLKAIYKKVKKDSDIGFANELAADEAANAIGSSWSIYGLGRRGSPIPEYIVSAGGEGSFKATCVDDREACPYCMIYITPFYK